MAQALHTRLAWSMYLREETVLIEFKLPNPLMVASAASDY